MVSIEEFCAFHGACQDGMEWALDACCNMDDVWQKAKGEWLIWVATRPGVATPKERRLLAVQAARSVSRLMTSKYSLRAVEVAERHAHGLATDDELAAARDAAWDAAWVAARATASASAREAADAALGATACAASGGVSGAAWTASAAAWAVAEAARDAAGDDASDAARATAWADFAQWARSNIEPNFTRLVSRDE